MLVCFLLRPFCPWTQSSLSSDLLVLLLRALIIDAALVETDSLAHLLGCSEAASHLLD